MDLCCGGFKYLIQLYTLQDLGCGRSSRLHTDHAHSPLKPQDSLPTSAVLSEPALQMPNRKRASAATAAHILAQLGQQARLLRALVLLLPHGLPQILHPHLSQHTLSELCIGMMPWAASRYSLSSDPVMLQPSGAFAG